MCLEIHMGEGTFEATFDIVTEIQISRKQPSWYINVIQNMEVPSWRDMKGCGLEAAYVSYLPKPWT